jgi:hypothetical protein
VSYRALPWDGRVEAEIAEWPGVVVVRREQGRKHQRLYVRFGETERYISYSTSPSDWRAGYKHMADVRRTLADMGATRNERRKSVVRRGRNRPDRPVLNHIPLAPVKADPWQALASIEITVAPPRGGLLREVLERLRGSVRRMMARLKEGPATAQQAAGGDK